MSTYSSLFLAEHSLITYSKHECNKIETHKEEYTILTVMLTKGYIPAFRIMMLFLEIKICCAKRRHTMQTLYCSNTLQWEYNITFWTIHIYIYTHTHTHTHNAQILDTRLLR